MNNQDPKKSTQPLEGEGSYTATRKYNQDLADASDSGDLEAGAEAARVAMEGPEREELERAAAQGKAGPKPSPSSGAAGKPARAPK
jgi:hypothetical protein